MPMDPDAMTLGALYMEGFEVPFYCYLDMKGDPDPIPYMDREMLFALMASSNIQRFECHGRDIEIEFTKSPEQGEEITMFALEAGGHPTVDGEKLLWSVEGLGGRAMRIGREEGRLMTPDNTRDFQVVCKRLPDAEDPLFENWSLQMDRNTLDGGKDVPLVMGCRVLRSMRRRVGDFIKGFGGAMRSGMYDDQPPKA